MNRLHILISEAKSITINYHELLSTITIETGSKLFGTTKKHTFIFDTYAKEIRQYCQEFNKPITIKRVISSEEYNANLIIKQAKEIINA